MLFPEIRAAELRKRLNDYNEAYYNKDAPLVSDAEYDELVRELRALELEHPELRITDSPTQKVGGSANSTFAKVRHATPMISLGNVFNEGELRAFDARVKKGLVEQTVAYICELKIDGLAVSLLYENGKLRRAATRGDGEYGEDVTANLLTINSVPRIVTEPDFPLFTEIRGEVYMPRAAFAELNREREEAGEPTFANPRNAAAGSLRQLDSAVTAARALDAFFYAGGGGVPSHGMFLKKMADWGFPVNGNYRYCAGIDEVLDFIREWDDKRHGLPYDTDGVVVKVDNYRWQEALGSTVREPRWATAWKFPPEQVRTRVLAIIAGVGRTGVVTPVAQLQPVLVSGSQVSNVTLHNKDFVAEKDIRIGDTVIIHKAGEIIPEVVRVCPEERSGDETVYVFPAECPSCGSALVQQADVAAIRCMNRDCPAQNAGKIIHFASRDALNIEGLGPAVVELLLKEEKIKDVSGLYQLNVQDLSELERFGEKSAENLVAAIEASKNAPLSKVLFGLGVRHVGEKNARLLSENFPGIDDLMRASVDELVQIENIGVKVAESITEYFADEANRMLVLRLKAAGLGLRAETRRKGILSGKKFVITGTLPGMKRAEAARIIENNGGKVLSAVSKSVDYVLAGAEAGSKLIKAQKLGIEIIDENKFNEIIGSAQISE